MKDIYDKWFMIHFISITYYTIIALLCEVRGYMDKFYYIWFALATAFTLYILVTDILDKNQPFYVKIFSVVLIVLIIYGTFNMLDKTFESPGLNIYLVAITFFSGFAFARKER